MKSRIRARKLRLRRQLQRVRAARRRARFRRARRKAIRLLKLRMRRHLQRLRLLARQRRAVALNIARLQRLRRYRMLARLNARQRVQRRRMMSEIRRRMLLMRQQLALEQRALRARFQSRRQRAARLRLLSYRIRVRQRRMGRYLSHFRRGLIALSKRMVYYRRLRRYRYLAKLRVNRQQQMKRASMVRVRWFRYQKQLAVIRSKQRMLALRQRRALKKFQAFQRNRRLMFMQQQQRLRKFVQIPVLGRVRAGKKRGDILNKKRSRKNSPKTIKKAPVPKEFHSADYFWSFEDSEGNLSHDAVRKQAAQLMGGSFVVSTSGRGHVADTSKARGWISLGDFKGRCFSDPDHCRDQGMTIMASLKLNKEHFHKKSSTYFLSSGGQTTKARGFAFLHLLGRYIVILSTKNKQWKMEARGLPQGWANLAITWKKDGLLKMYVNGKEVSSGKPMSVSRPKDQYSSLEVGRPNNSHSPNFRVPLEVDNIALWEKALTSKEINVLANKDLTRTSKQEEKKE